PSLFQMRFFFVFLLIAGVFSAPVDLEDIEDDFTPSSTVATAEDEKPIETPETVPEVEHEPEVEPSVPETEEPVVPAETEAPAEEPEETPAPETEAPELDTVAPEVETEAPVTETEAPIESPTEAETEAPAEETSTSEVAASETGDDTDGDDDDDDDDDDDVTDDDTDDDDDEDVEDVPDVPVEATKTKTGAEATMKDVTVRFVLNSDFGSDGTQRKKYIVKITNNSDKLLCGVTFTAANTSHLGHLFHRDDSDKNSISTEPIRLAPGKTANQFSYTSIGRTHPTLTAVTFCE
ncbi:hypothetical protein PMAYCL1PPCAC_19202, partial [Pristionchus mayeri]